MKDILALTMFLTFAFSCNAQDKNSATVLPPKEFAQKFGAEPKPQLIDVRTPDEFAAGHIEGAANIDWYAPDFEKQAAQLDKRKPVYVYCKVGGRSGQAAQKLTHMGYTVFDLQGGFMKWEAVNGVKGTGGMSRAEFDQLVASAPRMLVNFHAPWCAPCKKMEPYMSRLDQDVPSVKVIRLNADQNKALLSSLQADEIPLTMFFENGKQSWKQTGFIAEADLKAKLK